jgi:hypothetical protein
MRNTVYVPAAIGFLIGGTTSVLQAGWTQAFIGAAISAAVLGALLAARAWWLATRKVAQIVAEEVDQHREQADPDPSAERLTWVAPVRAYDLTAITPGRPDRSWRNLTTGDLAVLLHQLDVPSYEADADRGDTTVNGVHITWQPSTDTTGETR